MKVQFIYTIFFALAFSACETKAPQPIQDTPPITLTGKYINGAFIINEGNYGSGNAEMSFFSLSENKIYNDIFKAETKLDLGDVAQSAIIHDTLLFICVNNSGKIEVVGRANFTHITTLKNGLSEPRFMAVHDNKLFVTDWGINGVRVFNLNDFQAITTISTSDHPEQIKVINNEIWVANTGGCFRPDDNTISVINPTDFTVTSIEVGENPTQLSVDAAGNVIVLCAGRRKSPTCSRLSSPELVALSSSTKAILWRKKLGNTANFSAAQFEVKENNYYVQGTGGIYRFAASDTFPEQPYIKGQFYGFQVQPTTNQIYTVDAIDFNERGWLKKYQNSGQIIDSFRVGMIPNSVIFN